MPGITGITSIAYHRGIRQVAHCLHREMLLESGMSRALLELIS